MELVPVVILIITATLHCVVVSAFHGHTVDRIIFCTAVLAQLVQSGLGRGRRFRLEVGHVYA